jgi:DNA-binding transcriptional regulator LsrR (DeoR family)
MPAYKRMRDRGLQPPNIDSAVNLENEVGDQMDINHRQVIPTESKARDAVREQIGEVMETLAPHPKIGASE